MTVRAITSADIPAVQRVRLDALRTNPLSFTAAPGNDIVADTARLTQMISDASTATIFAAFDDDDNAMGMVGLRRLTGAKTRHRAEIWGFFVQPDARGRGIGKSLMQAAIAHARSWDGLLQIQLAVGDIAPDAKRLYGSLGFKEWGREPRALLVDGRAVEEHHMTLFLDSV